MSRWTTAPPSPVPIGTRSRSRAGPLLPGLVGVEPVHVAEREQLHEVGVAAGLGAACSRPTPLTVCSGVSRRANASAVASEHWSTLARITSSRSRSAWTG